MPSKTASEAFNEGQLAGHQERAAGLNPYKVGTTEYSEWERGRMESAGQALDRRVEAARRVA